MKEGRNVSIIRELREEADLTAFALASKSGVSLSSINRLETGKVKVTRRVARKVIKALNEELNRSITLEDIEELVK
jgi:predicted transcriptional regulator